MPNDFQFFAGGLVPGVVGGYLDRQRQQQAIQQTQLQRDAAQEMAREKYGEELQQNTISPNAAGSILQHSGYNSNPFEGNGPVPVHALGYAAALQRANRPPAPPRAPFVNPAQQDKARTGMVANAQKTAMSILPKGMPLDTFLQQPGNIEKFEGRYKQALQQSGYPMEQYKSMFMVTDPGAPGNMIGYGKEPVQYQVLDPQNPGGMNKNTAKKVWIDYKANPTPFGSDLDHQLALIQAKQAAPELGW